MNLDLGSIYFTENLVKKIVLKLLILRILSEEFKENKHTINSYLRLGPLVKNFLYGETEVHITHSTGQKKSMKAAKLQYLEEAKDTYNHASFEAPKIKYELDKTGFDDESSMSFNSDDISLNDLDDIQDNNDSDDKEYSQYGEVKEEKDEVRSEHLTQLQQSIDDQKLYNKQKDLYKDDSRDYISSLTDHEAEKLTRELFTDLNETYRIICDKEMDTSRFEAHKIFSPKLIETIVDKVKYQPNNFNEIISNWDNSKLFNKYKW